MAYAAYAYDCVNLLALAAQAAGSDDAEDRSRPRSRPSAPAGRRCQRFAPLRRSCWPQGRNIDLDGASGDLELQDDGDVGVATYDVFAFDEQGQDESTETHHDPGRHRLSPSSPPTSPSRLSRTCQVASRSSSGVTMPA